MVDNLGFSNDDALDGDEGAARYKLLSLYAVCGVLLFYRRQLGAARKGRPQRLGDAAALLGAVAPRAADGLRLSAAGAA